MYIAVTFWYSLQEFHTSLKTVVTSRNPKKRQRRWIEKRLKGVNKCFSKSINRGLASGRLNLRTSQNLTPLAGEQQQRKTIGFSFRIKISAYDDEFIAKLVFNEA